MAEAVVRLKVDATNANKALSSVQAKTQKLQGAFGGLKTAIAGIGIGLLAKQAVQVSSNFDKLNVRLGLLTKQSGTFAKSQQIAADAQKAFGLSATEALSLFDKNVFLMTTAPLPPALSIRMKCCKNR